MRYPIAIEPGGENTAFGVVIPDLPGCFSAGDTLEEAYAHAAEAIELWMEATQDTGGIIPAPTSLKALRRDPELAGWILDTVEVDTVEVDLSQQAGQDSQRLRRR